MCRAAGGELCRGEGQRSGAGKQQRGLQRPDRLFKLFLAHFEAAFKQFDTKSWLTWLTSYKIDGPKFKEKKMREKIWLCPNPIQCHGELLNQGLNTFGPCNLILWDIKLSTTKILSWPYGQQAEITEGAALHCCANFGFNAGTTNALQHWDIALNSSLNLFLCRAIWSCNLLSLLWCIQSGRPCHGNMFTQLQFDEQPKIGRDYQGIVG